MKYYFVIVIVLLWSYSSFAQQDVELMDVKQDNEVLLYAQNNRSEEVEITLHADIKGYTSSVSIPHTMKIATKTREKVLTLTPTQEIEHGYQFSVSYNLPGKYSIREITPVQTHIQSQSVSTEIDPSKIYIFSKNGCGRCALVTKYLKDKTIGYIELNTSEQQSNNRFMFDQLEKSGFKGGSVTMPVILYKNKVHYNIPDLTALLKSLDEEK